MDFDGLHKLVGRLVNSASLWKDPELYVYDTTLRIGAKADIQPVHVYLHAGTSDGARHLGIGGSQDRVAISTLPKEVRVLEPDEIEDFLCIYKQDLKDLAVGKKLSDLKMRRGCAFARPHTRCCQLD